MDTYNQCEYFTDRIQLYTIPEFAALWCGVQKNNLAQIIKESEPVSNTAEGRQIRIHPKIPCLKPKCMYIVNAIKEGKLIVCNETNWVCPSELESHTSWDRMHIRPDKAIEWLQETDIPVQDLPGFIFYSENSPKRGLDARTETTYRIIIYSLLKKLGKEPFNYDKNETFTLHRNLTNAVSLMVETAGFSLHKDTIRKVLQSLGEIEHKKTE